MSWKSNAALPLTADGRRRALDGIRAIAVLAVLVGHATPQWLPGGAVGVDMFFVLSGYLITEILLSRERSPGTLARFWAGRARRLIPPLVVTIVVTATVIGITADRTADLWARWQQDLWSAAAYVLNWRLIATGGDYDVLVHGQAPHAHLWSLAVEEQFYLLWPLILAVPFIRSRPGRSIAALLAISAGALLLVAWGAETPDRVLWGTDARAVQLLAGAGLAVLAYRGVRLGQKWAPWCSSGGLVLLVVMFAMPGPDTPTAAAISILSVTIASASLIIGVDSGWKTPVAQVLSTGPLVALGVISYAVYLWHLPVLWFWQTTAGQDGPAIAVLVTLTGSILLASISWILIESPLRGMRLGGTSQHPFRRPIAFLGISGVLLLVTSAYVALTLSPTRAVTERVNVAAEFDCPPDSPVCQFQKSGRPDDWNCDVLPCTIFVPDRKPSSVVMLGGDSVARSLAPGLIEVARERDWLLLAAGQGCSYIAEQRVREPDFGPVEPDPGTKECRGLEGNLRGYARNNHVDLYIGFLGVAKVGLMINGEMFLTGEPDYEQQLAASVRNGLDMLSDTADSVLIVVPPRPSWDADCAGDRNPIGTGCDKNLRFTDDAAAERRALLNQEPRPSIVLFDSDPVLCPDAADPCPPGQGEQLWRYDGKHLTLAGSRVLARALEPTIVDTLEVAANIAK